MLNRYSTLVTFQLQERYPSAMESGGFSGNSEEGDTATILRAVAGLSRVPKGPASGKWADFGILGRLAAHVLEVAASSASRPAAVSWYASGMSNVERFLVWGLAAAAGIFLAVAVGAVAGWPTAVFIFLVIAVGIAVGWERAI